MKKIINQSIWLIVLFTIAYYIIFARVEGSKFNLPELLGKTVGTLLLPFIIASIRGLIDKRNKNFTWYNFKKLFAIIWLILLIISFVFDPKFGLLSEKNDAKELVEMVKQYTSEANISRRAYHDSLEKIAQVDISSLNDITNMDLLNSIKVKISKQQKVEHWHYLEGLRLIGKWEERIKNFHTSHRRSEISKMIETIDSSFILNLRYFDTIRTFQSEYYLRYNSLLDFLIQNKAQIKVSNDQILIKDISTRSKFNELQGAFSEANEKYLNKVQQMTIYYTDRLIVSNKTFNLKEVDTLVEMVRNNNYR